MSILHDSKDEWRIELELYFNPEDKEWANYLISVYKSTDNHWVLDKVLSLLNKDVQFLDIYYENELQMITNGFDDILESKIDQFVFSPIDEKDFTLKISESIINAGFNLQLTNNNSDNSTLHLSISKQALREFAISLKAQCESVFLELKKNLDRKNGS
ncbi:MAG: hypothetical protein IPN14_11785 [Bacteroidetes bacterium]|nr:hypothetical protein [Bacteroidota bacterium]